MSLQVPAEIGCPRCGTTFAVTLYRSIWIEYPENRKLIFDDKINAVTCPACTITTRLEFPFLCTNVKERVAVWYEPYPDPEIDKDVALYATHNGPDSFYATAPRIRDWKAFKEKIVELEQRPGTKAPIQMSVEMQAQMRGFIDSLRHTEHHTHPVGLGGLLGRLKVRLFGRPVTRGHERDKKANEKMASAIAVAKTNRPTSEHITAPAKPFVNAEREPTRAKQPQARVAEKQAIIERRVRERFAEAQKGFDYQFQLRQGTHKAFLVGEGVLAPSRALKRSDDWYTCLSVYAATLLAVTEARLPISQTVLDRYRAEVLERMLIAERDAAGADSESWAVATTDIEQVAHAVGASCARKGSYVLEPIAHWFAVRLSAGHVPSAEKPLAALLAIEATACRDELLPAFAKEFDG